METPGIKYFYYNYVLINREKPQYRDSARYWFELIKFMEENPEKTVLIKQKR